MKFIALALAFFVFIPVLSVIQAKVQGYPSSCSDYKSRKPSMKNGKYVIDPDGKGGKAPFTVLCDMNDKEGVGVTVISHDSEKRTLVKGFEIQGSYKRNVKYTGASLTQLADLTRISTHCEQFIRYECRDSVMFRQNVAWLVSRGGVKMKYWGGASPGSNKCACGMNNTCANPKYGCNCDMNDYSIWRQDSGLLTHKPDLPVSQLRFGDTGSKNEKGYHTLGKLRCYGRKACTSNPCLNGGTCIVLFEGYKCSCAVGFTGSRCEKDIDECKGKSLCDKTAECKNTAGSYKCVCKKGYRMYGKKCQTKTCSTPCQKNERCVNNFGTYKCVCRMGYVKQGFSCVKGSMLDGQIWRGSSLRGQASSLKATFLIRTITAWVLAIAGFLVLLV